MIATVKKPAVAVLPGEVYCPACTHTVAADVELGRRSASTVPGQKCPQCASALDAASVVFVERAA
jgi:hypothetical protein